MNGATTVTGGVKQNRRLVLHFNVNKTIVMKDTANNINNATLTVSMSE